MGAKWQRVKIPIDKRYKPNERRAIAREIVEKIRQRTQDRNVDKNGRPFPKYSKDYVESLDFKIAGKSRGDIDLTLSGDMLTALDLLSHKSGELMVGYENGTEENAKADGNIRGTYGSKRPNPKKKRDFLGIMKKELNEILKKYPLKTKEIRERQAEISRRASEIAEQATQTTSATLKWQRLFRGDQEET
jgi:hypothetical protein